MLGQAAEVERLLDDGIGIVASVILARRVVVLLWNKLDYSDEKCLVEQSGSSAARASAAPSMFFIDDAKLRHPAGAVMHNDAL